MRSTCVRVFADGLPRVYKEGIRGFFADRAEARLAAEREIDCLSSHSAIVAITDLVAYGVMDALRAAGIVPGCLLGLAVGDAVGTSVEFASRLAAPFRSSSTSATAPPGGI